EEGLLMALLLSAEHQYHDLLRGRQPRSAPRQVAPAIDAVHAEPRRPHTVAALAAIAGVSPRQLGREFHREFGMSPMAYVREVRLAAAHAELLDTDRDESSVTAIAHRWGFVRTDDFTARYQARFRVTPTMTLHHRSV